MREDYLYNLDYFRDGRLFLATPKKVVCVDGGMSDMGSIYKSEKGRKEILLLYDRQLERLSVPLQDIYVDTSFGKTHIVETGNLSGVPLLVFHGGNATTAYNLIVCSFLQIGRAHV